MHLRLIGFVAPVIITFLFVVAAAAQPRTITKAEYEKAARLTVAQTSAFPFVFSVETDLIENGKVVSTVTEIDERQSQELERITQTTVAGGKTTRKYQVMVGFGKNYCSDDGVTWRPPTPNMCFGPESLYGAEEPESVEYTVEQKTVAGKKVSLYREYSVFAPSTPNARKDFRDDVSTIDSAGNFIGVVTTEGKLDPRTTGLVRKQSWKARAQIEPIVVPIK
jgi:hypothetical protein